MHRETNYNLGGFKLAMLVCLLLGLALIAASFYVGKINLFLLMNGDMGEVADQFFKYITLLGDGSLWVAFGIYAIVRKRMNMFPLLIAGVVISTILIHLCKQIIFPLEARPFVAIGDQYLVHYVRGVAKLSYNSFPSGHTCSAFTYALTIIFLNKNKVVMAGSLLAAMLVGYSRVYLGHHFPLDVGAGILIAFVTMLCSLPIQHWFDTRRLKKEMKRL